MKTIDGAIAVVALLPALLLPTFARATDRVATHSTVNRHRIEFGAGYWDSGYRHTVSRDLWGTETSRAANAVAAFSYSYWTHERIAPQATFRVLIAEATSTGHFYGDYDEHTVVIMSVMFGARFYPFDFDSPLRPYVAAGIGPYIGVDDRKERAVWWRETTTVLGSFGGHVGAGLDIQMGRYLMLDVRTGYNLMADFEEPLAGEENFSGVEFGAGISLLI